VLLDPRLSEVLAECLDIGRDVQRLDVCQSALCGFQCIAATYHDLIAARLPI
jgi:hypothetical protein